MDATSLQLTPQEELNAGQSELIRGVWLTEILIVLKSKAIIYNLEIGGTLS